MKIASRFGILRITKPKTRRHQNMSCKKYSINLGRGKVKIAFTPKELTAYGGFSLLSAFFDKIRFNEAIESLFPVAETSNNRIGIYEKVLSFTLTIFAGGSRFSHILYLGGTHLLSRLFGVKRMPKASSTLTRLFNRISTWSKMEVLSENVWNYLQQLIPWKKIKEDWLTFDSSVLERYGSQQGARKGYNPKKKGRPSHHVLIAFLNMSKYVLNVWNRPGNTASFNNICGFFDATWERVKDKLRIKGVLADNGFYEIRFIKKLEKKNLVYIIGAKLYSTLQRKVYSLSNWTELDKGIWISEFQFKPDKWEQERRYIAVRQDVTKHAKAMGKQLTLFEVDTRDYRYSVHVTNSTAEAKDVWLSIRKRANDENTIKELKEDFALGGFCLQSFYATEAAMLIRALIYNLFVLFRRQVFGRLEERQQLKTLRYKYFVIPGYLGSSNRVDILRLSVQQKWLKSKLIYFFNRVLAFKPVMDLNCIAVKQ